MRPRPTSSASQPATSAPTSAPSVTHEVTTSLHGRGPRWNSLGQERQRARDDALVVAEQDPRQDRDHGHHRHPRPEPAEQQSAVRPTVAGVVARGHQGPFLSSRCRMLRPGKVPLQVVTCRSDSPSRSPRAVRSNCRRMPSRPAVWSSLARAPTSTPAAANRASTASASPPSAGSSSPTSPWSAKAFSVWSGIVFTVNGDAEPLDVERVRCVRVLGAGAGPEQALHAGTRRSRAAGTRSESISDR